MHSLASFMLMNQFSFRHLSLILPMKLSAKAFSTGLPERMKANLTLCG
jgi:hypothetical protein